MNKQEKLDYHALRQGVYWKKGKKRFPIYTIWCEGNDFKSEFLIHFFNKKEANLVFDALEKYYQKTTFVLSRKENLYDAKDYYSMGGGWKQIRTASD